MSTPIPASFLEDLSALGVTLPPATIDKLAQYLDQLLEANSRFNLTAVRDRDTAWRRHIVDSLTLVPLMTSLADRSIVADVGSGGGLPGIPLALALPELRFTLIEATGKKARFLEQCVRELHLSNVRVINQRAETVGQDESHRQQYHAVVCRALGLMSELLEYVMPLLKVGGTLLAMKGPSVGPELDQAADALATLGAGDLEIVEAYPVGFEQNTVIVRITKARATPRAYPRKPGMPRQTPL